MDATDAGLFGDEQEDLFNKPTKVCLIFDLKTDRIEHAMFSI